MSEPKKSMKAFLKKQKKNKDKQPEAETPTVVVEESKNQEVEVDQKSPEKTPVNYDNDESDEEDDQTGDLVSNAKIIEKTDVIDAKRQE